MPDLAVALENRRVTITYEWRGEFANAAVNFQACGFTPTNAGLIALPSSQAPAAEP